MYLWNGASKILKRLLQMLHEFLLETLTLNGRCWKSIRNFQQKRMRKDFNRRKNRLLKRESEHTRKATDRSRKKNRIIEEIKCRIEKKLKPYQKTRRKTERDYT
ncbi:hypothetical protein CEXT_404401 [Caerostris extrusa]|uniref:Uncharacterized protein n=1 Tax=Caerostris extrusa TaxID=172846 RepID=A0AAV4XMW7_CAEEX|nr:hypothetical protein CEXT_404401 [Caerostris extrusa]